MKRSYSTDLSDPQWGNASNLTSRLPTPEDDPEFTPPARSSMLFFYVLKSGCPWRLLPHDLERLVGECLLVVQEVAYRRDMGELERDAA
jgi:hypothetical protein